MIISKFIRAATTGKTFITTRIFLGPLNKTNDYMLFLRYPKKWHACYNFAILKWDFNAKDQSIQFPKQFKLPINFDPHLPKHNFLPKQR